MNEDKFPKVKKSVQDFLDDEDGSITRNKVLMIGGMVIILGVLLGDEAYAAHRTHYTHRTHSTHRTSNNKHGSHSTHSSHYTSHSTHSNHYTHGSHSSHASHVSYTDASNYASTNTSSGRDWPSLPDMQSFKTPSLTNIATPTAQEITSLLNSISAPEISDQISQLGDAEVSMQTPPNTPQFTQNKE